MTTDNTYNGWRNVETWRVQLHLANDEATARTATGIAFLYVTRFQRWPPLRSDFPETFAQWLREYVEERMGVGETGGTTFEMLSRDWVEGLLSKVDWDQLAAHWLDVGRGDAKQRGVGIGATHGVQT